MAQNALKLGLFHLFVYAQSPNVISGKIFDLFFDLLVPPKWPIVKQFGLVVLVSAPTLRSLSPNATLIYHASHRDLRRSGVTCI